MQLRLPRLSAATTLGGSAKPSSPSYSSSGSNTRSHSADKLGQTSAAYDGNEKSLDGKNLDEAYYYVRNAAAAGDAADASSSTQNLRALRWKIDWRIVPIMFCCYTMQFVDKVLLNYAAVMGLNKDLRLTGNEFSDASTWFFFAYLIAEVPNAIILQKVPPGKWLGANVVLWGIATACTAATHNYRSLLACRIFLGIFEAAIAPSLMLVSSQWYTKSEQAPRFSIWYSGLGLGQIIGGVVSYAFQHVHKAHFYGWKIMFLVLGVVTVVIGLCTLVFLPDSPLKARFLSQQEKVILLKHVSVNQTGVDQRKVNLRHVVELLLDIQIWLLVLITVCISISSGIVTTYSATVIKNLGYTPERAALLNTPSGAVSIFSTLAVGFGVRLFSNRWAWLVACCIPGIIGGGLMSFAHQKGAQLAGVYLINFIVATLIIIYQWTASNVAGHTKRVIAVSLISASFSVGNTISPQTFQARDAPNYRPAKIAVLATQAGGAFVTVVLFFYYVWANRRKQGLSASGVSGETEAAMSKESGTEAELWEDRTDKENPSFRYVY